MARDPEHILSACGILTPQSYRWLGHPRPVIGLYPGLADKYVPPGENLAMSRTFLNQFVKADGNYLMTDFRTPCWVHSTKKQWWSQLTTYILDHFSGKLKRLGFYEVVGATCHGIQVSLPNFYAIIYLYCPSTGIFFIPVGSWDWLYTRCEKY